MRKFIIRVLLASITFTCGCALTFLCRLPATAIQEPVVEDVQLKALELNTFEADPVESPFDDPPPSDMAGSIGLIVLSDEPHEQDFIRLYNEDGSLWLKFSFYSDYQTWRSEPESRNLRPFAFHFDYFLLVLKCIKRDKGRYEVVVNERTGLRKYVRADDRVLKFETWKSHLLGGPAVDSDQKTNPLRRELYGRKIKVGPYASFTPVKVVGEWLKVRWRPSEKGNKSVIGWLRWRDGQTLLVDFLYLC